MKNKLEMCSIYLEETESRLMALLFENADLEQRSKIALALSFIRQARTATANIQGRVDLLKMREGDTQA